MRCVCPVCRGMVTEDVYRCATKYLVRYFGEDHCIIGRCETVWRRFKRVCGVVIWRIWVNSGRKLVVESISEDGRRFRPSDWVERISARLAQFGPDHRLHYSNAVQPHVIDGAKCLVIDMALKDENPQAYDDIMAFVRANHLRCREVDDDAVA